MVLLQLRGPIEADLALDDAVEVAEQTLGKARSAGFDPRAHYITLTSHYIGPTRNGESGVQQNA